MSHRSSRMGFTLIELLVVIAILSILVGLLMPAVQKLRDAAARVKCANNLKQLGLGLQNYHATHGSYPHCVISKDPKAGKSPKHGWPFFILPYIDQLALHDQYYSDTKQLSLNWYDAVNARSINTRVEAFLCPTAPPRVDGVHLTNSRQPLDYPSPNRHNGSNIYLASIKQDPTNIGIFAKPGIARQMIDITDGTSNTLLLVEDAGRNEHWQMGISINQEIAGAGGAWGNANPSIDAITLKIDGFDPATKTMNGSCAVNCDNDGEVYSFHPRGANVLMADGAVRFLRETVSVLTLVQMVTRNGGEVIPGNVFE